MSFIFQNKPLLKEARCSCFGERVLHGTRINSCGTRFPSWRLFPLVEILLYSYRAFQNALACSANVANANRSKVFGSVLGVWWGLVNKSWSELTLLQAGGTGGLSRDLAGAHSSGRITTEILTNTFYTHTHDFMLTLTHIRVCTHTHARSHTNTQRNCHCQTALPLPLFSVLLIFTHTHTLSLPLWPVFLRCPWGSLFFLPPPSPCFPPPPLQTSVRGAPAVRMLILAVSSYVAPRSPPLSGGSAHMTSSAPKCSH